MTPRWLEQALRLLRRPWTAEKPKPTRPKLTPIARILARADRGGGAGD